MRRSRRVLLAGVVLVALAGCAIGATLRSYDLAPNGLERSEERLRLALTRARGDSGVHPRDDDLPSDALVKSLYEGTFAYYSGRYGEAGDLFDRADQLAEARYTKSISQNALAMLTNDRELDYEPGINERLMMHYFAALAYWRKGDGEGATVEARKLAYLLQKHQADTSARDRSVRQTLRTFVGVLFEAAGERNDALVSYRNAQAIAGERVNADSLEALPSDQLTADSGDVVVVIEQGFVAFPTPWDLTVPIYRHEWGYVSGEDRFRGGWMSARVGNRLAAQLGGDGGLWWTGPAATLGHDDRWAGMTAGSASDVSLTYRAGNQYAYRYDPRWGWAPVQAFAAPARLLKLSVPVYKRPRALGAPTVAEASGSVRVIAAADLSEAEVADFDRVRAWTYARAVLRVAVKAVAAEEVEKAVKRSTKDEKKGDRLGQLFGFLASAAGAVLERADTRSWNLLPQAVTLVRVRVPVSAHDVRLVVPGGTVLLPLPRVRPRGVTLATARIWSGPAEW